MTGKNLFVNGEDPFSSTHTYGGIVWEIEILAPDTRILALAKFGD